MSEPEVPPPSFPRLRARTRRFTLGRPRTIGVYADGTRVLFLRAAGPEDPRTGLWVIDLPDGEEREVLGAADDENLSAAERARRERMRENAAGVTSYAADRDGRVVAAVVGGHVRVADVDSGDVREVTTAAAPFDPRPDPSGERIAYLSGGSLRLLDLRDDTDRQLAGEGDPAVSWGRAEFVASEEMDRFRGFWWAPDGAGLLATRVDESPVPQWWIADPAAPDTPSRPVRYPAAGSPPADVSLWLLSLEGDRIEVRWDRGSFPYLGRVSWTAAGDPLLAVMSRDQRSVVVLRVDVRTGDTRQLVVDRDDAWVDLFDGVPAWLGDDVVRIADVGGSRRLLVGDTAVTPPELQVRAVAHVGTTDVVLTASGGDPTQVHVHRWTAADGLVALTTQPGVHTAVADGGTTVIGTASLDTDGTRTIVHTAAGAERELASYAARPGLVPRLRLLRLGERNLAAGLLLPRDHVPGQRLPVLLDPYGGPHAQRVLSSRAVWLESQWFADQGFAVLVVDGRGTPGRGPAWEHEVHLDLAGPVLDDQVDALHAAAALEPDLDLSRVAIRGWSFGGYLAALAVLRRPDVFHAAVAGAPVTDWSLYDTVYTERYLGRPQERPEVYRRCSLLGDAPSLSRPLLIVHGLADDNVVAAHSLRLSQRLTEAGRPHAMLPLTGVTHMTPQEAVAENLLLLQVEFLHRELPRP